MEHHFITFAKALGLTVFVVAGINAYSEYSKYRENVSPAIVNQVELTVVKQYADHAAALNAAVSVGDNSNACIYAQLVEGDLLMMGDTKRYKDVHDIKVNNCGY